MISLTPFPEVLPAVDRDEGSANGILRTNGNIADAVFYFMFVAFLDASGLSTVGVGRAARVVIRP